MSQNFQIQLISLENKLIPRNTYSNKYISKFVSYLFLFIVNINKPNTYTIRKSFFSNQYIIISDCSLGIGEYLYSPLATKA